MARRDDTTGSREFEDVRGDGGSDTLDVQTLFDSIDDQSAQEYARQYDFSGVDPDEISVLDVQALFNETT